MTETTENLAPGAPEARDRTYRIDVTEEHIEQAKARFQMKRIAYLTATPLALALTEWLGGQWSECADTGDRLTDLQALMAIRAKSAPPVRDGYTDEAARALMASWEAHCLDGAPPPEPCQVTVTVRVRCRPNIGFGGRQ